MLYFHDADGTCFLNKHPYSEINLVNADTNISIKPVDQSKEEEAFYKKIRKAYVSLLGAVVNALEQEILLKEEPRSGAAIVAGKISDFGLH